MITFMYHILVHKGASTVVADVKTINIRLTHDKLSCLRSINSSSTEQLFRFYSTRKMFQHNVMLFLFFYRKWTCYIPVTYSFHLNYYNYQKRAV